MSRERIRILLVGDHAIVRSGLRLLLDSQPGLEVVGEAGTQPAMVAHVAREQPDVVLLDLELEDDLELELLATLRDVSVQSRLVVLTGARDPCKRQELVRLGAVGLVYKEQPAEVLVQAIKRVSAGQVWLEPDMLTAVLSGLSRSVGTPVDPEVVRIALLTEREREVIELICEGLPNRAIGARLSISESTVRHHLTSIFSKLGTESRLELLIYAFRNGLVKVSQ